MSLQELQEEKRRLAAQIRTLPPGRIKENTIDCYLLVLMLIGQIKGWIAR